jgi:hypothetical protein
MTEKEGEDNVSTSHVIPDPIGDPLD